MASTTQLEDLSVRQANYWKEMEKGRQNYPRGYASWREGDKVRHVYLGSVRKMNVAETLGKARRLKANVLGSSL